ncbi:MAG: peptidylprolyl isomerase [Flammeovirgaceae bacterium]
MLKAKNGDVVKVHYVGKFENGEVFDSSVARHEPIEFTVGAGQMIKGFDNAVVGMMLQEKKSIKIPCAEAYGEINPENFVQIPMNEVPADIIPHVGMQLELIDPMGRRIPVLIAEVNAEFIVLDANHPMAGKDLWFDIQLLEIVNQQGRPSIVLFD